MRIVLIALLLMTATGCAALMQGLPVSPAARQLQDADRLAGQGKYAEAHDAYLKIAAEQPRTSAGEQAAYQAARLLVAYKNPSRDYRQAVREFEAFLKAHPSGKRAEDAASWLALLGNAEQSRMNALLDQVDALTKKAEQAAAERKKTEAERDAAAGERDVLRGERDELRRRIDALLQEKESLLTERTALLQERDGLAKDKVALEKKVEALTRDKERLLAAKAKLEQRLRDVTDVDIRMEKKRRKVK
jgi:chromosome segregation ATPase